VPIGFCSAGTSESPQIRGTFRNGFIRHVPSPDRTCSRNRVPKVVLSGIIPYLASEEISLGIVSNTSHFMALTREASPELVPRVDEGSLPF
jgi:hypothetical protein